MHVFFICVQRAECGEIRGARASVCDKICPGAPSKFGPAAIYCDNIRHHAGVSSVSVREWMNSRNELVMKPNQAFVDRKGLVVQPIPYRYGSKWLLKNAFLGSIGLFAVFIGCAHTPCQRKAATAGIAIAVLLAALHEAYRFTRAR